MVAVLLRTAAARAAAQPQVTIERTGVFATVLAAGRQPVDAVPTRDAGGFYFLGSDERGPNVSLVSHLGAQVTEIFSGAPLASPDNLALSDDNERIFVADPTAGSGGAVVVLDAFGGGVLRTFANGYQPRGIDTALVGGSEMVYFTGVDPQGALPGVFRSAWGGTDIEVVAKSSQLSAPSGVAVGPNGEVYVTDTPGQRDGGRVLKVVDGAPTEVASGLWLGSPAGLALTIDGSTLAVSGLTPATGGATVDLIEVASGKVTMRDDGIAQNRAAGGVHRAKSDNIFGWAGRAGSGNGANNGTVYRIEP
jgi:NHL repeat